MQPSTKSAAQDFRFTLAPHSGVPVYRQLIDQVQAAIATGALSVGDQLPTVRRVAVDLEINPNTVVRAYREMELRGVLDTQQGTGTFIAEQPQHATKDEQQRQLAQLVTEFVVRAGSVGLKIDDLMEALRQMSLEAQSKRR